MKILYFKQIKKDFCIKGGKLQLTGPLLIDPNQENKTPESVVSVKEVGDAIGNANDGFEPKGTLTVDKMPLFEEDLFNKKGSNRFDIIKIHTKGGTGFIQEVDAKGRIAKVSAKLELKPGEYDPLTWKDFNHDTHKPDDATGLGKGEFRLSDFLTKDGTSNYISKKTINLLDGTFYLEPKSLTTKATDELVSRQQILIAKRPNKDQVVRNRYIDLRPGDKKNTLNTTKKHINTGAQPWKLQYNFNNTDGLVVGPTSTMVSPTLYFNAVDRETPFEFGDFPVAFVGQNGLTVFSFPYSEFTVGNSSDYTFPLVAGGGPPTNTSNVGFNRYSNKTQFRSRSGTFYDTEPRGRKKLFQFGDSLIYFTEQYRGSHGETSTAMTLPMTRGYSLTGWVPVPYTTNDPHSTINKEVTFLEDKFVVLGRSTDGVFGDFALRPNYVKQLWSQPSEEGRYVYQNPDALDHFKYTKLRQLRSNTLTTKSMRDSIMGNGDSFPHNDLIFSVSGDGEMSVLRSSSVSAPGSGLNGVDKPLIAGYGSEDIGLNVIERAFGKDYIINGFTNETKQGLSISPACVQIATTANKVHIFACAYVKADEPVLGKPTIKQDGRVLITTTLTFNKDAKTIEEIFLDEIKTYIDWLDADKVPYFELDRRDGLLTCTNFSLAISSEKAFFVFPNEILFIPYTGGSDDYRDQALSIKEDLRLAHSKLNDVLEVFNRWELGSKFTKNLQSHIVNEVTDTYRKPMNIAPVFYGEVMYIYRDNYKATLSDGLLATTQTLTTQLAPGDKHVMLREPYYNRLPNDGSGLVTIDKPAIVMPHWFDLYHASAVKFYQEFFIEGIYLYTFRLTIGPDETTLPVGTISLWRIEINGAGTPIKGSEWTHAITVVTPTNKKLEPLKNTSQLHLRTYASNGTYKHLIDTISWETMIIKFPKVGDKITVSRDGGVRRALSGSYGDFINTADGHIYISTIKFTENPEPIDKFLHVNGTGKWEASTSVDRSDTGGWLGSGNYLLHWAPETVAGEKLSPGMVKVSSDYHGGDIVVQRFATGTLNPTDNLQFAKAEFDRLTGGFQGVVTVKDIVNMVVPGSKETEVHIANSVFYNGSVDQYLVTADKVLSLTNGKAITAIRPTSANGGISYRTYYSNGGSDGTVPSGILERDRLIVKELSRDVLVGGKMSFIYDDRDVFQKVGKDAKNPTTVEFWSSMISTESLTFYIGDVRYVPDRTNEDRSGLVKSNLSWIEEGTGKPYFGEVWDKLAKPVGFRDLFTITSFGGGMNNVTAYMLENQDDLDSRFPEKMPIDTKNIRYYPNVLDARPWMKNNFLDKQNFDTSAFTYDSRFGHATGSNAGMTNGLGLFSELSNIRLGRMSGSLKVDLLLELKEKAQSKNPGIIKSNDSNLLDNVNVKTQNPRVFLTDLILEGERVVISTTRKTPGVISVYSSLTTVDASKPTTQAVWVNITDLKTADNTRDLTPVLIGTRLYLFEEGTARSYYSVVRVERGRVYMGPVIESTNDLPGVALEYPIFQNVVYKNNSLYFFPGYHKDYLTISQDVNTIAAAPDGPNAATTKPTINYYVRGLKDGYETPKEAYKKITVPMKVVLPIDITPAKFMGYGRMEPIFLDTHMLLFVECVDWRSTLGSTTLRHSVNKYYTGLVIKLSADKTSTDIPVYTTHVDSIDMRVLRTRIGSVSPLIMALEPVHVTMWGRRIAVSRSEVQDRDQGDYTKNRKEIIYLNVKWDYRNDPDWYIPDETFDQGTVRFTVDEETISTSKSEIVEWCPTTVNVRVFLKTESDPKAPLEGLDSLAITNKDGKKTIGDYDFVKEEAPGTYLFKGTSSVLGKENLHVVHADTLSDKSVAINYVERSKFQELTVNYVNGKVVPVNGTVYLREELFPEEYRISETTPMNMNQGNVHTLNKKPYKLLPGVTLELYLADEPFKLKVGASTTVWDGKVLRPLLAKPAEIIELGKVRGRNYFKWVAKGTKVDPDEGENIQTSEKSRLDVRRRFKLQPGLNAAVAAVRESELVEWFGPGYNRRMEIRGVTNHYLPKVTEEYNPAKPFSSTAKGFWNHEYVDGLGKYEVNINRDSRNGHATCGVIGSPTTPSSDTDTVFIKKLKNTQLTRQISYGEGSRSNHDRAMVFGIKGLSYSVPGSKVPVECTALTLKTAVPNNMLPGTVGYHPNYYTGDGGTEYITRELTRYTSVGGFMDFVEIFDATGYDILDNKKTSELLPWHTKSGSIIEHDSGKDYTIDNGDLDTLVNGFIDDTIYNCDFRLYPWPVGTTLRSVSAYNSNGAARKRITESRRYNNGDVGMTIVEHQGTMLKVKYQGSWRLEFVTALSENTGKGIALLPCGFDDRKTGIRILNRKFDGEKLTATVVVSLNDQLNSEEFYDTSFEKDMRLDPGTVAGGFDPDLFIAYSLPTISSKGSDPHNRNSMIARYIKHENKIIPPFSIKETVLTFEVEIPYPRGKEDIVLEFQHWGQKSTAAPVLKGYGSESIDSRYLTAKFIGAGVSSPGTKWEYEKGMSVIHPNITRLGAPNSSETEVIITAKDMNGEEYTKSNLTLSLSNLVSNEKKPRVVGLGYSSYDGGHKFRIASERKTTYDQKVEGPVTYALQVKTDTQNEMNVPIARLEDVGFRRYDLKPGSRCYNVVNNGTEVKYTIDIAVQGSVDIGGHPSVLLPHEPKLVPTFHIEGLDKHTVEFVGSYRNGQSWLDGSFLYYTGVVYRFNITSPVIVQIGKYNAWGYALSVVIDGTTVRSTSWDLIQFDKEGNGTVISAITPGNPPKLNASGDTPPVVTDRV